MGSHFDRQFLIVILKHYSNFMFGFQYVDLKYLRHTEILKAIVHNHT